MADHGIPEEKATSPNLLSKPLFVNPTLPISLILVGIFLSMPARSIVLIVIGFLVFIAHVIGGVLVVVP